MPAWRYLGRARGCRRRAPILGRPEASYGESRACLRGLCPVCVRHLSISRCTIRFRRCTILLICSTLVRRTFKLTQGREVIHCPSFAPLVTPMPRTLRNLPTRAPHSQPPAAIASPRALSLVPSRPGPPALASAIASPSPSSPVPSKPWLPQPHNMHSTSLVPRAPGRGHQPSAVSPQA